MTRRKTFIRIGIGLAALALVLAVFAWQQGDDEGGGPLNAIAAAAEKTQGEPGGRAAMRMKLTAPDPSESLTMTGQAVYDDAMERTEMLMNFRDPDSGDLVEMEMVMDGSVLYFSSSALGDLPGDSRWMSLDLSAVTGMDFSVPTESDPQSELEALEDATGVRKLGKEEVRGVQTTRYAGLLSEEDTTMRLEVWVDAKGLVRRMRMFGEPPGGDDGPTRIDMRMDFFDFGPVPAIEVPAENEVFDATSIAEEERG